MGINAAVHSAVHYCNNFKYDNVVLHLRNSRVRNDPRVRPQWRPTDNTVRQRAATAS